MDGREPSGLLLDRWSLDVPSGDRLCQGQMAAGLQKKGYLRDQRDPGLRSLLNPMADRDSEEKKDGPVWFSVVWADVTQQSCLFRVSDPGRDAKHLSPSP